MAPRKAEAGLTKEDDTNSTILKSWDKAHLLGFVSYVAP